LNTNYIAHIRKTDKQPQPLQTHLAETAAITKALMGNLKWDRKVMFFYAASRNINVS